MSATSVTAANAARICVPVCVHYASELREAVRHAAQIGDMVELRLDCLLPSELDEAIRGLPLHAGGHSCIFTLRPQEQGGAHRLEDDRRRALWAAISPELKRETSESLIDIELDLALDLAHNDSPLEWPHDWNRVICSHHDFDGVPARLEQLYEQMASTPAGVLKIAVQAASVTDCLPVFRLLDRAKQDGRKIIAIAMGTAGAATRILGPARGAYLTYGAPDADHATAPGQITALELRDLYRVHELNEQTTLTGIIGLPVTHSLSPHMHNAAFASAGLNAVYIPFEVDNLPEFMRRMVHPRTRELDWNLRGLSVTAPHKTEVMEHLDWIDPPAREIGAVNTIVVEADHLRGYNTDAAASVAPLRNVIELQGKSVAVIGAGGAARAVLWSLQQQEASATIFARHLERARPVAEKFGAACAPLDDACFGSFDVVINTTPLGTRGEHERLSPVTADQLRGATLAYDLVYNPPETRFLLEARAAGLAELGGLPMLVEQAVEQFKLWTGGQPSREAMRVAAERKLGK